MLDTAYLGVGLNATCDGDVTLTNGISDEAQVVLGGLDSPGTLDLNDGDVEGHLIIVAGGDGEVIDGGLVSGIVNLATAPNEEPPPVFAWSGQAYFAGVAGTSTADAAVSVLGPLEGTITIGGDVAAYGFVEAANITDTGNIEITGEMDGGTVNVGGDCEGAITAGSMDDGRIVIVGNLSGNVTVEGDASGASRIFVYEHLDSAGVIAIGGPEGDMGALGELAGIAISAVAGTAETPGKPAARSRRTRPPSPA